MQLVSSTTKQLYTPSTPYLMPELMIDEFEPRSEVYSILYEPFFAPIPVEEVAKGISREISVIRRSEELINVLEAFYLFRNQEEVKVFLLANNYLIEILFEAHWQIKRVFGVAVTTYLELHHDPEEEFEELFIVAKSTYSPEEARKLMDQLDEEWFLDVMNKTQGKMCITEEPL